MSEATGCVACALPILSEPRRPGPRRKYHRECNPSGHRHEPLAPRSCRQCGVDFQPKGEANVYCSRACRERARTPLPDPRNCEFTECVQEFQPVNTMQRSCSPHHARLAWKERNPERDADIRRNVYHRRRARKKGGLLGELVIRADIAERDNWTCYLCTEAIPRDAAWPDPLSLSMDHVVPLSKGGLHDPSNVKAAHLRCNVEKGDQLAA